MRKKGSRSESSRHPTEDYYTYAASFTQKHTIVETASRFGISMLPVGV